MKRKKVRGGAGIIVGAGRLGKFGGEPIGGKREQSRSEKGDVRGGEGRRRSGNEEKKYVNHDTIGILCASLEAAASINKSKNVNGFKS